MKQINLLAPLTLLTALAIAGCAPSSETQPVSTPTPTTVQTQAPRPPMPVAQQPRFDNYLDAPQTRGTWTYARIGGGERAGFGLNPQSPIFLMRCTGQRIALVRSSDPVPAGNLAMSIKTETTTRNFTAQQYAGGVRGPLIGVALDPNDPLLDAMAITKGRIAIETEGMQTLYLPAWPEISRVIEDCR